MAATSPVRTANLASWLRQWPGMALAALALALGACGQSGDEAPAAAPPRTIPTLVVEDPAAPRSLQLPGVVQADTVAALAFAVAGTIERVDAVLGAQVEAGQRLAALDPERYRLRRASRAAELDAAEAVLREREAELERQRAMFREGFISEAAFDRVRLAHETAVEDMRAAERMFELAERDLEDTVLRAPHSGRIAARMGEPGEETAAGQPVFMLERAGGFEVHVLLPETVVGHVHRGDRVRIDVPAAGLTAAPGQVVKLGSRATDANAFPLEATLARDTPALRAGMTAEVTFTLSPGTDEAGFLLPLSAVRVEAPGQKGWVFVYDSEGGTVHRTPVRLGALHAGEVEVRGGIRPGDRIAAAGVELLRDGQEVRAAEHAP